MKAEPWRFLQCCTRAISAMIVDVHSGIPNEALMSADIVNLRQARKAKARADKEKLAEENRAKFGRSKAERERLASEQDLAVRKLDQHRRDE
jgi:hypothetical protein